MHEGPRISKFAFINAQETIYYDHEIYRFLYLLPAEKFLSYLIDSTQGTCFVIQDDNQSLNIPKVIRMYIQDFKRVTSQVLQCLLICLLG